MTEVIARLKVGNKTFEVLVDLDRAMEFKHGKGEVMNVLGVDEVFADAKKGMRASEDDLKLVFKTIDVSEIAAQIIRKGEVQLTVEYRKKLRDAKVKQVVDFLSRNCIDPKTNLPHPPQRITNALDEAGVKIDEFKTVEQQINDIIKKLQPILPIKLEFRRIAIKVPSTYTGSVYGVIREYARKEEWASDGSLLCVLEFPAGLQQEIFAKLNSLTHGTVESKEVK